MEKTAFSPLSEIYPGLFHVFSFLSVAVIKHPDKKQLGGGGGGAGDGYFCAADRRCFGWARDDAFFYKRSAKTGFRGSRVSEYSD